MDGLLDAWDWDEPVDVEYHPSGLINRTYWVRGPSGKTHAVLQGLNTKVFRAVVHHDIKAVTEQVARRGLTTAFLVPTRLGELWHTDAEGGVWRRMTVVGDRTIDKLSSPKDARSAGELVARWHAAVQDLDHEFQMVRPDVHDTQRHMDALSATLSSHRDHRLYDSVAELADLLFAAWKRWEGPTSLPMRVVHGDLKISNVRFEGDSARALIDLDTVARRTLDVEMGDALRSWCNPRAEDDLDARFDIALFSAAMEGYAAGMWASRFATPDEWASFVPCTERIALELSARFAKDALEESYFAWDEKFGGHGEHNLVRAQGQQRLASSLASQRRDAEAIVAYARAR